MKYILPELMRGAINDAQERMRQQQQRSQPTGPEITNTQKETKPLQGGEYIDYEEVK